MTGRSEVFYPTAARADGEGFEELFHAHHERVIRVITRVIRDPGRAEEVAVEVFWKFWRTPKAHGPTAAGWLHRTAVRLSLNELRRYVRATRNESLASRGHGTADPEQILAAAQEQEQVRRVLAGMKPRDAELLLLRSSGFSYEDVAAAMRINPASVGTLISRAQQAFRKDYVKRYGEKP